MSVLGRARQAVTPNFTTAALMRALPLVIIIGIATFTRFWRLGTPDNYYFDEIYHAFTAREYLDGNKAAWEFFATPPQGFAYEWTHPPLAKLFMAGGMTFLGENPFAWRFFSALFGVGSVILVYLLGKKLFKSETAALAAAFLATFEGLWFVQSRIAMNDSYAVFFILGALYFMLSERHLAGGILLGAAWASKWSAVWAIFPILLYFGYRVLRAQRSERHRVGIDSLLTVPYYYFAIPFFIYLLSYLPFFLVGHNWGDWWDLQRQMYWYHSRLEATHPYQSPWDAWPIDMRPIYYYVNQAGDAKIYALGNPIIFWLGLPALAFAFWQVIKKIRLGFDRATGDIAVSGRLGEIDFGLLFVVVGYLAFILPWALSPRIMFFYHYLPSVPFLALAAGYAIHRLWQTRLGRPAAAFWLIGSMATFIYLYPHLAAVAIPNWLAESYFWFPSWR